MKNKLYIGTSGWVYKAWHHKFYPPELKKDYLPYYSSQFQTVEINNTFYRLPNASVFLKWRAEAGENFVFSTKLSRTITHNLRLLDARIPVRNFLKNYRELDEHRGPILVQLPPWLKFDIGRLESFFHMAKDEAIKFGISPRWALEPRHLSWFDRKAVNKTLSVLEKSNAAPVIADSGKYPSYDHDLLPQLFVYVRLYGPEDFAASNYAEAALKPWANRLDHWIKSGRDCFLYFNNDVHGYAIDDARILLKLMKSKSAKIKVKK